MQPLLLASTLSFLAVVFGRQDCSLRPAAVTAEKSPGDNYYRLLINGGVERYVPGETYVVTLVGSRTHEVVQQFSQFTIVAERERDIATVGNAGNTGKVGKGSAGSWQLFGDARAAFHPRCPTAAVQASSLPVTEVQLMWRAPPPGSGCVLLKAMVFENASRWFAADGQLTRRVCEDTSSGGCCACDDAKYRMVFEGLWSAQTHPKDYPVLAQWLTHFSDVVAATHTARYAFWGDGMYASDGFRSLAEWGSAGLLERELRAAARLGAVRGVARAPGLWYPKVNTNTSARLTADTRRHRLSVASMFGPSPDWVVGVSGLELCRRDCSWEPRVEVDLYPWDAGTDSGVSYMSPNAETMPREKMHRITNTFPEDPRGPFYGPGTPLRPLARLTLVRESLKTRPCGDEALKALVDADMDDSHSETADKPECAVSPWSAWSPCSVSCGKGLRTRTRGYLRADDAQIAGCDRSLVSKEMCAAGVAECPDIPEPDEDNETVPSGAPDVCAVGPWGGWSPCSARCGPGVRTRRRPFLDHMGVKKCPLTVVEETEKCSSRPCGPDEAPAEEDPRCPATAWGPWAPCSATCGRGHTARTRLLLTDDAGCGHIKLKDARECADLDSCEMDMQTAKQVCMEAADPGPCRGEFSRWAWVGMKGMCVPFPWGGCQGNRNNFLTQQDCLKACSVTVAAVEPANDAMTAQPEPGLLDCAVSAWGAWSRCSVSCGRGVQRRTRTVLRQASPGGAPCPARLERRRRCSRPC